MKKFTYSHYSSFRYNEFYKFNFLISRIKKKDYFNENLLNTYLFNRQY